MEQLWLSMGLVTPLIQFCRVISLLMVMPCLLSNVFRAGTVRSTGTFVSGRLLTPAVFPLQC